MKKLTVFLMVSILSVFLMAGSAFAIPLTNTSITPAEFTTLFGSPNTKLSSTYDFAPPLGIDGTVYSQVFTGTGAASNLFAYTYQIQANSAPIVVTSALSLPFVPIELNFDLGGSALADSSFYISSGDVMGNGTGTLAPIGGTFPAVYDDNNKVVRWNWINPTTGNALISSNVLTYVVGVISNVKPDQITGLTFDSGKVASPQLYSPVPEPATMLLVGAGLLGLGAAGRRKFFKKS